MFFLRGSLVLLFRHGAPGTVESWYDRAAIVGLAMCDDIGI